MAGYPIPFPQGTIPYLTQMSDPRALAANQRAAVWDRGNQLTQQNQELADQGMRGYQGYSDFLDPIEQQLAGGGGGYNPDEQFNIMGTGGPNSLNNILAQGNQQYLSGDEQQQIAGNPDSWSQYFNPDSMQGKLDQYQGGQNQAVSNLQNGLRGSINQDALQQDQGYRAGQESQLDRNQGTFNTILDAQGNNVRGAIDPAKLSQSNSANSEEKLSPEAQQALITGAGISAGLKDTEAADDVTRQALASGAGAMGVGAYRARLARQQAIDSGNAMTQARGRVAEQASRQALAAEQQRLQAQQGLTNTQVGSELQMGQEALQGQQHLGEQALAQRNVQEQNRQQALQYLTGANLDAARAGGAAELQNAQQATQQQMQQGQFSATQGTQLAQAQEQARAQRAAALANNRQNVAANQQNVALQANQAQSQRGQAVGNARMAQQNTGLGLQAGQQQQQNKNAQDAYGRQQQTYGTQAGASNQATALGAAATQTPTTMDKIVGGIAGGLGAIGGFFDEGGVVDKPTIGVVGENGPELIKPLGDYRARTNQSYQQIQPIRKKTRMSYGEAA